MAILGAFLVAFGPSGGPLGSQMVDLGCLDTDWVGGNDKDVLDAILLCDGLKLKENRILKNAIFIDFWRFLAV